MNKFLKYNGHKFALVVLGMFIMSLVLYVKLYYTDIKQEVSSRSNNAEYIQDTSKQIRNQQSTGIKGVVSSRSNTTEYSHNNFKQFRKPEIISGTNPKAMNPKRSAAAESYIGMLTGPLFSGEVIREMIPIANEKSPSTPITVRDIVKNCEKWAVVTTIYKTSDAVSHLAKMSAWCIVIIADTRSMSKKDYVAQIHSYNPSKHIYLTIEEQERIFPVLSKATPYKNFARKNIGYMYAILKGAKFIWDFDDDNTGVIEPDEIEKLSSEYVTPCKPLKHRVVNPYFYYGVNETFTWPRGIPLQLIREPSTNPKLCKRNESVTLGVLQSLANNQPDVDAIYRLTRDTPFNFKAKVDTHKMFLLPQNAYCPFNAQATLWTSQAFKYLMLPTTMSGRVSDIWRSYIAEFFFQLSGNVKVAFVPPYVFQERNCHNYIRDFNAELDLYQRSQQLVDFLSNPETSQKHNTMVSLYNALYMRGYMEQEDVHYVVAWQTTFKDLQKSL